MEININFSGDTISLTNNITNIPFTITGTGTLTSNYIITTTGSFDEGSTFTFYYKGVVDKATYNFNILGTNLSTVQLNRESTIVAVYNGVSWNLNITPNTKSTNWISANDLMTTGSNEVLIVPVSFEAGEQCVSYFYLPYNCIILNARFSCTKALSGTDAGSVNISDVLNATTVATLTIPLSTVLNTQIVDTAVNYPWENANQNTLMSIETIKTTNGGKGLVSMVLQRT